MGEHNVCFSHPFVKYRRSYIQGIYSYALFSFKDVRLSQMQISAICGSPLFTDEIQRNFAKTVTIPPDIWSLSGNFSINLP